MAHFKRRRTRRTVCTPYRWMGNHKFRRPARDRRALQADR